MTRIKIFLSMLLVLSICLMPACALAESDGDLPAYSMITITLDNLSIDDSSLSIGTMPLELSMSIGADGLSLDSLRALVELDIGLDGEDLIYLSGALEDNEVKLHIAGMSQDISIPMNQALESLLSDVFLYGEPLSEAPPEFMEAFGDLLNEINTLVSDSFFTQTAETPSHYYYSEDDWRAFFVEYPARMRAVPAGEEEIVFEGKTYTARKYTYHVDRLNSEEYTEYKDGLVITNEEYRTSTAATEGLEDALNRMYEIGYEMWEKKYADENSDDMTVDETFYSEEGTFYLIDEVMGTLETGTRTAHYSDGTEYTENIEFMSYFTDTEMVTETVYTSSTGFTREASSVTIGEDGTFTIVTTVQSADTIDYSEYTDMIISYTSDITATEVISDTLMTIDEVSSTSYSYNYVSDGTVETQSETSNMHSEITKLSDTTADLAMSINIASEYGGETLSTDMAMDLTLEMGMLPDGTLLRVSGKPFNPLEASEEELTAYADELSELLMNIISSLVPSIETPSSVGGALIG